MSSSTQAAGRSAGLAYLVLILFSGGGYATLTWLLAGGPQIVLARLAANHALFVVALAAAAIGFAVWVVLGVLLFRLMSSAGRLAGLLMLFFVAAGAIMSLMALSHLLPLVWSANLDAGALAPMVQSYSRQLLLAQVFSGLWLFPFGWLVMRSRAAPRVLGLCLMVGGLTYLLQFATAFEPSLGQLLAFQIVSIATLIPAMVGEFGIAIWLIFKGARDPRRSA